MENYNVDPRITATHEKLNTLPAVKKALDFIDGDGKYVLEQQIKLASIPAPTFHERKKAELFCEYFKELGLQNIHIDEFGNAIGIRPGKGKGSVLMEAHMDTVFDLSTELNPWTDENGCVHLPGISDDTSGMANIIGVIRALNEANIETDCDLYFVGTVEEEGMGALGGMRKYMSKKPGHNASISIDTHGIGHIVYQGTGIRTMELNFHSKGGHAAGAFGKVSNSLYAAARAVVKIASIEVTPDTGTIYCVSNFHAGNDAGINAVAADSQIKINYRSQRQDLLEELHEKIFKACEEACAEETARWGCDTVTWDHKIYCSVPAVTQTADIPIVQSLYTVYRGVDIDPIFDVGGATNCTEGIYGGVQSVCIGAGGNGGGIHTPQEYFDPAGREVGIKVALLLALMMAGVSGETEALSL